MATLLRLAGHSWRLLGCKFLHPSNIEFLCHYFAQRSVRTMVRSAFLFSRPWEGNGDSICRLLNWSLLPKKRRPESSFPQPARRKHRARRILLLYALRNTLWGDAVRIPA